MSADEEQVPDDCAGLHRRRGEAELLERLEGRSTVIGSPSRTMLAVRTLTSTGGTGRARPGAPASVSSSSMIARLAATSPRGEVAGEGALRRPPGRW